MSRAGIIGLGLWAPDQIRRNDAWSAAFVEGFRNQRQARNERDFTNIEKKNPDRPFDDLFIKHAMPHEDDPFKGAVERRVDPDDGPTSPADARAAVRALEDAGVDPRDVDLVLSSALIPDRLAPSNGPSIQHLAGCTRAAGIGLEAYCSSAVAQLDLASGLVESGRARFVVCVQSHLISRFGDLSTPMSPIFGDATAAFVVGPVPDQRGVTDVVRGGDGALAAGVTHVFKDAPDAVWWKDANGPMSPGSQDRAAGQIIARNVLQYPMTTIRDLLTRNGVPIDAVAVLSAIQPMIWYQPALADGLGMASERVPSTYSTYAHIGSAALVANLLEARRRGQLVDGAPVILYAHGAGVTRYGALLKWSAPSKTPLT